MSEQELNGILSEALALPAETEIVEFKEVVGSNYRPNRKDLDSLKLSLIYFHFFGFGCVLCPIQVNKILVLFFVIFHLYGAI